MLNAVIKSIVGCSLILMAGALISCGDNDKKNAESILTMAEESLANHDFERSLALLDSIDSAFPKMIEIRKKAMTLRPKAMEGVLVNRISETDSLLAVTLMYGDSLSRNLVKIDNPVEPYYISKSDAKANSQYQVEGLHGRVSPDGMFYIIASSSAAAPFTTVTVETDVSAANTSAVNPDGERNRKLDKNQVVTYIAGECDEVGRFLADNPSVPITVTLINDGKVIKKFTLSETQHQGLIDTYLTAGAFMKCKLLRLEKAKLEKQLGLSRQQIADML